VPQAPYVICVLYVLYVLYVPLRDMP